MTRVAVIGNAGGGKSTLFRQLSLARPVPYFPVDRIQWRPGWRLVSDDEFAVTLRSIICTSLRPWPVGSLVVRWGVRSTYSVKV